LGTVSSEYDALEAVVLDDGDAAGADLLRVVFDELEEEPLDGVDTLAQGCVARGVDGRWGRVFRNVFHVVTFSLGVGRAPGS
jgi:hypothetical protein